MMQCDLTRSLFKLLVQEFRLWQDLAEKVRAETQLLVTGDLRSLSELAQRKRDTLSRLTALQRERLQIFILMLSEQPSLNNGQNTYTGSLQICSRGNGENKNLLSLTLGIQATANQIAERSQANYALADCRVKRMWALNGWLVEEGATPLPEPLSALMVASRDSQSEKPLKPLSDIPLFGLSPTLLKLDQEFIAWVVGEQLSPSMLNTPSSVSN